MRQHTAECAGSGDACSCPLDVMPIAVRWKVTFYNPLVNRRCELIDFVDEAAADLVVARFGDAGDEFHRLQQVRKEQQ